MRLTCGVRGIHPLGGYPRIICPPGPPQEYIKGLICQYHKIKLIIIMICTIVKFIVTNPTIDALLICNSKFEFFWNQVFLNLRKISNSDEPDLFSTWNLIFWNINLQGFKLEILSSTHRLIGNEWISKTYLIFAFKAPTLLDSLLNLFVAFGYLKRASSYFNLDVQ
jgi:hypothetical protein